MSETKPSNRQDNIKQIDFNKIACVFKTEWRTYLKVLPATFLLSCLLILCVPRYYECNVSLAPELTNNSSLGSLAGMASAFGIDLSGSIPTEDAISPSLYPDLINSTDFLVSLFPIEVVTKKGERHTYFEHLDKHQKEVWWESALGWTIKLFKKNDTIKLSGKESVNPFMLSKKQQDIATAISNKIACVVDKKTDVISITVTDQDPLVCATIADSVRVRLQDFITQYRTKKACNDLAHTQKLYQDAKLAYEKSRKKYSSFVDRNQSLVLESYRSRQEDLENEMQLRYNIYSSLTTQLQLAQAKVQERTPAFTTLQRASVPIRPAGPKRMIFVATMTFLAFIITTIYKYVKA